jgi:DNA ligase D-like protein (predicted polymerase)
VADLLAYFERAAVAMLPFLHDRPLVLHEPGKRRFVRQAPPDTPDFVEATGITSPDTGKTVDYLLAQDRRSLLWLAERGHIEIHGWHSRVHSLGCPDYAFFDLDPSAGTEFPRVREVALLVKKEMDGLGLRCYVKTSGLTGLQIYVPTEPKFTFVQVRDWTRKISSKINEAHPDLTTMEWKVEDRRGVFLDHMMMAPNKNAIVPFSPRETGGTLTISMPLAWDELAEVSDARMFTIDASATRLKKAAANFAPVVQGKQRLPIDGTSHEVPHVAGPDWRHAGRRVQIRCVVGGWAPPEGESSTHMGSVLLGLYYAGELAYVGKAPVPHDARHELYVKVAELHSEEPPFINLPKPVRGAHWANPALVCCIECSGLTGGPDLRAPAYLRLMPDIEPRSCTLEQLER